MGDHDSTAPIDGEPESTLPAGSRVGDYEIVRALGRGSYGAVYEALRRPLGKRVALKMLHVEHAARRELVARFTREALVVAGLEHPHIVDVFDVGTHDGVPFLAMEYLDGETLGARLAREGRLPCVEAVDLLLGVVSAVAAAHARNVIHRDLKPDNIFLARMPAGPPLARLLDFGVAKVLAVDVSLTGTRGFLGTPLYMSPEQAAESRDLTGATDQWSLAVILYECVTGARPFQAKSLLDLLNAISDSAPVPAHARESAVPPGLSAVLARALEKPPEARFPSVSAFGAALLPYASATARAHAAGDFVAHAEPPEQAAPTPPSTPGTFDPASAPSRSRATPRRALAAVGALAALGLLALGITRARPPPPAISARSGAPVAQPFPRAAPEVPVTPLLVAPVFAPSAPAHPVDAGVPSPLEDASSPLARPVRGRGSTRRAARPREAPPAATSRPAAPADCPNGICPVD